MENKNIDNINNPNHYKLDCGVESIEIIKRVLGIKGFVAFCLGNILKYLIRAEKKRCWGNSWLGGRRWERLNLELGLKKKR